MDPSNLADAALAVPACIAVVKAARTTFPKIDGVFVLGVSLAAGEALSWLFSDGLALKPILLQGALWGLSGSGFMVVADRVAGVMSPAPKA